MKPANFIQLRRESIHDCAHDHGEGKTWERWVTREVSHMKEHWFSCLASCVVVHEFLDLVKFLFHLVVP